MPSRARRRSRPSRRAFGVVRSNLDVGKQVADMRQGQGQARTERSPPQSSVPRILLIFVGIYFFAELNDLFLSFVFISYMHSHGSSLLHYLHSRSRSHHAPHSISSLRHAHVWKPPWHPLHGNRLLLASSTSSSASWNRYDGRGACQELLCDGDMLLNRSRLLRLAERGIASAPDADPRHQPSGFGSHRQCRTSSCPVRRNPPI